MRYLKILRACDVGTGTTDIITPGMPGGTETNAKSQAPLDITEALYFRCKALDGHDVF
jgi:hypothetical protein